MNFLLIFFAIPIAIIILSIIFESFIRCPLKIAGIVFSIFLIVTFAIGEELLLIATIVYTLIAFLSAWFYEIFRRNNNFGNGCSSCQENEGCGSNCSENNNCRNAYQNYLNTNLLENNLTNSEIQTLSQYENNCCNRRSKY